MAVVVIVGGLLIVAACAVAASVSWFDIDDRARPPVEDDPDVL